MTVLVDFLPPAVRERQQRARRRRGRPLLAVAVLAAVLATDLAFQHRIRRLDAIVGGVRRLVEQREGQIVLVERDLADRRRELAAWIEPLGAPGMAAVLDRLCADLPPAIRFQELTCRIEPWAGGGVTELRLDASTREPAAVATYLAALEHGAVLPKLELRQTVADAADGWQRFRLERSPEVPR